MTGEYRPRVYDPYRLEDSLQNIGEMTGSGETIVGVINDLRQQGHLIPTIGPMLSLFAGEAYPETRILDLLPPDTQQLIAIDYNPILKSSDPRIHYTHQDIALALPQIETDSIGILTLFGSDGSIDRDNRNIIKTHIIRVLKKKWSVNCIPLCRRVN